MTDERKVNYPVDSEVLRKKINKICDAELALKDKRKEINAKITAGNSELIAQGMAINAKKFALKISELAPDEQQQELLSLQIFLATFEIGEGETSDMFDFDSAANG